MCRVIQNYKGLILCSACDNWNSDGGSPKCLVGSLDNINKICYLKATKTGLISSPDVISMSVSYGCK